MRYTLRGTSYLLRRIGFSPQMPARRAAERDEKAIATWRTETWARGSGIASPPARGSGWRTKRDGLCIRPCGGDTFAVAVGFARRADQEVRWISVGLRCLSDGTLGVYTDWKIDYAPTSHLLTSA